MSIFAETAGQSAQQFADSWESNAGQAFTQFVEGLGEQGDQAIVTLQNLGLEDQRLIRSFLSLANAGDVLSTAIDSANQEFIENNALNEEAAKRFGTTASQIQLFKNNIGELGITMGEAFLPTLNETLGVLLDFAQGWFEANKNITDTFESLDSFIETLKQMPSAMAEVGAKIGQTLQKTPLLGSILGGIGNALVGVGSQARSLIGIGPFGVGAPGRANGGPVTAGRPFVVGEQGPELFVPSGNGSIIPNGAGGVNVNVVVNGDVSGRELVEKVQSAIMNSLRLNTKFAI